MAAPLGGWGSGPWGTSPWGGFFSTPGGPLPAADPFDIFCLGQNGALTEIFTHPDVEYTGDPSQFTFDFVNGDLQIGSGGLFLDSEIEVSVNTPIPQSFTLQFTVRFNDLPTDFNDLVHAHVYIGASDPAGAAFALFFSQIGMLYTGAAHVSGGNLVLDSVLQPLPNSQTLISVGEYITFRVACDYAAQTTYVYATKSSDLPSIGHQLRYVLPGFISANLAQVPPEEVTLKLRGTVANPAIITLDELCLGTGLIIPNLPPRADAGADQAVRTCSIARLDGSRSFDPQGAPLTYLWQLVDAPAVSKFDFLAKDGDTFPLLVPTGFTNKLTSASLGVEHVLDPFAAGDVLMLDGNAYKIVAYGTDGNGFFAQVESYELPDSLPAETPFKVLRQRGLSGPTTSMPTFYPDVPGLYKFNLYVNNNVLLSDPAELILNVTESFLPHGVTPDLRFLWDYLSDFWRLVDDRERIEVFWGALAQAAAAELLNLWQIDYSKSLRDVQRTMQRKWLHYDLALYQSKALLEQTTARAIYGGLTSIDIPTPAGTSEPAGKSLFLDIPGQTQPVQIYFSGVGPFTPQQLAGRINAFVSPIDVRIVARVLPNRAGTSAVIRIDAPFQIGVNVATTTTLISLGSSTLPYGSAGSAVGPRTYRVEKNLSNLSAVSNITGDATTVTEGDFLVVDTISYRIARIIDEATDAQFFQRITLLDDLPATAGPNWYIAGQVRSSDIDFYAALASFGDVGILELVDLNTHGTAFAQVPILGASSAAINVLAVDLSAIGSYLADPTNFAAYFFKLIRRTYIPVSPLIVDVPYLSERVVVTDQEAVLRRNVDFYVETYRNYPCLRFVTGVTPTTDVWEGVTPPDRLWAEMSYLDNRPTIEANFGVPAAFSLDDLSQLPSNVDYLSAVRGLWYAYFNGPTIFNLRAGAQILLGLPFAEEDGTIEEIRNDFSTTTGRILVRDTASSEIVRSYTYPHLLSVETNPTTKKSYVIGDRVKQFAPLVQGVEVLDYVKSPNWFEGYLGQGAFYEVEKFFKFLVRVNSAAFNLSALLFVKSFLLRIKPTYTFPLFVVQVPVSDTSVEASASPPRYKGTLRLEEGPQTTGVQAGMWDDPRAGGGGYWGHYDQEDSEVLPTPPTPTVPVGWGFDQEGIFPKYGIGGLMTQVFAGGLVAFDGIFSYDFAQPDQYFGMLTDHFVKTVGPLATAPYILGTALPAIATGTVGYVYLEIAGLDSGATALTAKVLKNGVSQGTFGFTKSPYGRDSYALPISFAVTTGDMLEVQIGTASGYATVAWHDLMAAFVAGITWTFDVGFPAGTYTKFRSL